MELVRVLPSSEDEVNVACFHPSPGGGLVYGTKVKKHIKSDHFQRLMYIKMKTHTHVFFAIGGETEDLPVQYSCYL